MYKYGCLRVLFDLLLVFYFWDDFMDCNFLIFLCFKIYNDEENVKINKSM